MRDRVPARLRLTVDDAGRPQVQPGLGVADSETRAGQRFAQYRTARPVTLLLRGGVLVVIKRGSSRSLDRIRRHHPGVLTHLKQLRDHRRITRQERRAVAGQIRALRQRVHRDHAVVRTAAHAGVQNRHRFGALPPEHDVALVRDHQHVAGPRPGDDFAERLRAVDASVRIAWRIQPQ